MQLRYTCKYSSDISGEGREGEGGEGEGGGTRGKEGEGGKRDGDGRERLMGEGREGREKRPQLVPSYSSEDLKFTVRLHDCTMY